MVDLAHPPRQQRGVISPAGTSFTSVIFIGCADLSRLSVRCKQTTTSWHSQSLWNRPLLSPKHWQGQRQRHQHGHQQRQGQGLARTTPYWRPSTADCEERFYTQIVRRQAQLYIPAIYAGILVVRSYIALLLVYVRSNAKKWLSSSDSRVYRSLTRSG